MNSFDILTLALALVSAAYLGLSLAKSWRLYRKLADVESSGDFVEGLGTVVELFDERKKAVKGEMRASCYPAYAVNMDGEERRHVSAVRRTHVTVGQHATLYYSEKAGMVWAKGDRELLKTHVKIRLLTIACIIAAALVGVLL